MSRRNGYSAHTSPLPYVRIFGPGSLQISNPAITPFIAPGAPYIAPGCSLRARYREWFLARHIPAKLQQSSPNGKQVLVRQHAQPWIV